ncbi:MAG TPA: nitronate monooxygenase [Cellvibrionaceae bacterium]|nr:nitronate monooxygenase [Cellvibrionaceae bacterium]
MYKNSNGVTRRLALKASFALASVAATHSSAKPLAPAITSNAMEKLLPAFNLAYPIIQAPVGSTSSPELAAAVSDAGGLGSIALTWTNEADTITKIANIKLLTKRDFIVNYVLRFEPKFLELSLQQGAPIVQFSWGIPDTKMVELIRRHKARFGVQVACVGGARRAIDAGADYLVCQGVEAGGHVQSATSLNLLLPQILEIANVKNVPVFAAGGLSTREDVAAVIKMGAAGACLGTRFVASHESYAHPLHKNAIVKAKANDTALNLCFTDGWQNAHTRAIVNATLVNWEAMGCPSAGNRPGEGDILGYKPDGTPFIRYSAFSPSKFVTGDKIEQCAFYSGSGADKIKSIASARDILKEIWHPADWTKTASASVKI